MAQETYPEKVDYLEKLEHRAWLGVASEEERYEDSRKTDADKKRLAVIRAQHLKALQAVLKCHTDNVMQNKVMQKKREVAGV